MAAQTGCGEFAAGAIPIRLMQERDAMSVDEVFTTLDSACPLLFGPGGEWVGHPESMPAWGPGLRCGCARTEASGDVGATHDSIAKRYRFVRNGP